VTHRLNGAAAWTLIQVSAPTLREYQQLPKLMAQQCAHGPGVLGSSGRRHLDSVADGSRGAAMHARLTVGKPARRPYWA
jgi:hypothetical protein